MGISRLAWTAAVWLGVLAGGLWLSSAAALAAAPMIEPGSEAVTNVAATSAAFDARINPGGKTTSYHFEYDTSEYGTSSPHGTPIPIPAGDAGEGTAAVAVTPVHIQDLLPDTIYHFRVVAANSEGTAEGEDVAFTTQAAGESFALLDGRQWELVSPPNKHGASIEPIEEGVVQASEDGSAITYMGARVAVGAEPLGNTQRSQVISQRRRDGDWSSRDITTPHDRATGVTSGIGWEYRFFSPDLSFGVVEPQGETPLPPLPEGSERTIYRRNNLECEPTLTEAIPATCYVALVTKEDVWAGVHFGPSVGTVRGLKFVDATPDLRHVVLLSPYALTANARHNEEYANLYEWTDGGLSLVSVLPNGAPATEPQPGEPSISLDSKVGFANSDVRHAVSDNGSLVVWSTSGEGEHLYLRDMEQERSVQLDAGLSGGTPEFQVASKDGSKVFFTAGGNRDLYEFEVTAGSDPLVGALKDLTNGAGVAGNVLGSSEDGSYLYFVSGGVLPGSGAGSGGNNLYMDHYNGTEWKPTFITALSGEDSSDWGSSRPGHLGYLTARVSPDGSHVAFMSHASLTGYDNRDANSGERDTEVYLYDASHPISAGRQGVPDNPVCVSCDPTGARPPGIDDVNRPLVDRSEVLAGQWLAGSVPGWTPLEGTAQVSNYQSRYLSDSGRLFFDSTDALVPQDTNGVEDIYEYEPAGEGGCSATSAGFHEKLDGCVGLISSGTSSEESVFLDASATGEDVFFLTAPQLVRQDLDSSLDVYDAHVCSAAAPCAAPPASPPPCITEESCKAAPSPQPVIFGAPATATFSGAGNIVQPPPKRKVTPGSPARARQLAAALKKCGKKPMKKRAVCESRARKRYSATKSRAKTSLSDKGRR